MEEEGGKVEMREGTEGDTPFLIGTRACFGVPSLGYKGRGHAAPGAVGITGITTCNGAGLSSGYGQFACPERSCARRADQPQELGPDAVL